MSNSAYSNSVFPNMRNWIPLHRNSSNYFLNLFSVYSGGILSCYDFYFRFKNTDTTIGSTNCKVQIMEGTIRNSGSGIGSTDTTVHDFNSGIGSTDTTVHDFNSGIGSTHTTVHDFNSGTGITDSTIRNSESTISFLNSAISVKK